MHTKLKSIFLHIKREENTLLLFMYDERYEKLLLDDGLRNEVLLRENPSPRDLHSLLKRAFKIAKSNNMFTDKRNSIAFILIVDVGTEETVNISYEAENDKESVGLDVSPSFISYKDVRGRAVDKIISLLDAFIEKEREEFEKVLISLIKQILKREVAKKKVTAAFASSSAVYAFVTDTSLAEMLERAQDFTDYRDVCAVVADLLLSHGVPLIYRRKEIYRIEVEKDVISGMLELCEARRDLKRMLCILHAFL